jgi:hypothetical protein
MSQEGYGRVPKHLALDLPEDSEGIRYFYDTEAFGLITARYTKAEIDLRKFEYSPVEASVKDVMNEDWLLKKDFVGAIGKAFINVLPSGSSKRILKNARQSYN